MCREMLIIGLTGATGAGKTTVGEILREFGCKIIDCDKIAREAVCNKECIANLKKSFGDDIEDENGCLNRAELAKRAFSSDENTELLNSITHPVITNMVLKEIENCRGAYKAAVIDAPLLFEAGEDKICDKVIAVIAPFEIRLKRIIKRDNIDEQMARMRMERQHDNDFFSIRSDYVLDGTEDNRKSVFNILKELKVIT